ncbi:MAG: diguanylate cyclase (GGDEF)-like protein [Polaribacter sp.]|jgi:diguanylate cyclase (GGDEF)-like protein
MVDIDYFKSYNDNFGHDLGDIVLTRVAQTIANKLPRATDSVSRFGGEEFVVILPSTDQNGAMVIAERIRMYVMAMRIPISALSQNNDQKVVTVSIGVTTIAGDNMNEVDLLKQADVALYEAKYKGRNISRLYNK